MVVAGQDEHLITLRFRHLDDLANTSTLTPGRTAAAQRPAHELTTPLLTPICICFNSHPTLP